jgi:streptogramin lyase
MIRACLAFFVVLTFAGCSCNNSPGEAPPCETGTDLDGDGYGEGCPAGPDCNDANGGIHEDCCASDPTSQGCPCNAATDSVVACFDGPPDLANNPPCGKGERACQPDNVWGACVGQTLPEQEICDGADNDCDLASDEGVMSACGNCLPGCDEVSVGDDPFPFPETDPDVIVDGVGLDPNGDLVLDSSTTEDHFLWIANDAEGTVSKIDTRTGAEVARYASVTHDPTRVINHVNRTFSAWNTDANNNQHADNRPSRTTIDFYGDAYVANRAHDGGNNQPSVTKFINDTAACPDLNGDGLRDTSQEVNGTPGIQLTDPAEFFGEADECIARTIVVGDAGGLARALAIDAGTGIEGGEDDPGNVWVGMFNEQAFYQLDGTTGAILQEVQTPGVRSYGAAIDSQGRLWAPDNCCGGALNLGMINTTINPATFQLITTKPAFSFSGARGSYGIVVDRDDRVWIGGWPYGGLMRYDPATGAWTEALITGYTTTWGVRGVGIDTRGNVWAAIHQDWADGAVARIDADTATSTGVWQVDGAGGNGNIPVGVGVDFDGDVWSVNQSTSNASRLHIDEVTGEPAAHPTTGNIVDVFPVGRYPYTYSDFTGLGLRTVTRPSGEYTVPIQGCADLAEATWLGVTWEATTPPDTAVEVYVRVGNDLATLDQETRYGPWTVSPADLQAPPGPVPTGRYMLLTIRLLSQDNESTPIVHAYAVQWSCPGEPVD